MSFQVTFFTRKNCSLCDKAEADLRALRAEIPHKLSVVDIDTDPDLQAAYGTRIPVIKAGPYTIEAPMDIKSLRWKLMAARDSAAQHAEDGGKRHQRKLKRRQNLSRSEGCSYWISKRYLLLLNLFMLLYVGLPFAAPALEKAGLPGAAKPIYTIYSGLCHQLGYRSFYLYGEQAFYPRALAGMEGLDTFGESTGIDEEDMWAARYHIGDEKVGYKIALCQRDVAIYSAMFIFGVLYALTGRRLKPLPLYLWVAIGIVPIGLDGFSQLIGMIPWLPWVYVRESVPLLRVITGVLFGFTTAWFGYPLIEEAMNETRLLVATKMARIAGQKEKSE